MMRLLTRFHRLIGGACAGYPTNEDHHCELERFMHIIPLPVENGASRLAGK